MKIVPLFYLFLLTICSIGFKNKNTNVNSDPVKISSEEIKVGSSDFEGIISFDSFNEITGEITGKYYIKGNRIRIEYKDLDPSIFVPEKDLMIGIMMDDRRYMEIDLKRPTQIKPPKRKILNWKKRARQKKSLVIPAKFGT